MERHECSRMQINSRRILCVLAGQAAAVLLVALHITYSPVCPPTRVEISRVGSWRRCGRIPRCGRNEYTPISPDRKLVGNLCEPCGRCGEVQFEARPCTTTSARVCEEMTSCALTDYELVPPTPTSDRKCSPCTVCPTKTRVKIECSATADTICEPLDEPIQLEENTHSILAAATSAPPSNEEEEDLVDLPASDAAPETVTPRLTENIGTTVEQLRGVDTLHKQKSPEQRNPPRPTPRPDPPISNQFSGCELMSNQSSDQLSPLSFFHEEDPISRPDPSEDDVSAPIKAADMVHTENRDLSITEASNDAPWDALKVEQSRREFDTHFQLAEVVQTERPIVDQEVVTDDTAIADLEGWRESDQEIFSASVLAVNQLNKPESKWNPETNNHMGVDSSQPQIQQYTDLKSPCLWYENEVIHQTPTHPGVCEPLWVVWGWV